MSYFVRTLTDGGYLYLGRGKLGSEKMATPYSHPSAASLAIRHFNEKLARKALPPVVFETLPSKTGVPLTEATPFTVEAPTSDDPKRPEILVVPGNQHVRILKLHGQYEVCQKWASFSDPKEALAYAEQVTEAGLE